MLRLTVISVCLLLLAWLVVRVWRLRIPLRRLGDQQLDEDTLRARAEAVLAARLARGEIDDATYARTMQALWGLPPAALETAREPAPATRGPDPASRTQVPAETQASPTLPGELTLGDPPPEPYL